VFFFLILLDLLKDPVASEQIVEFWIGMLKGKKMYLQEQLATNKV